MTEEEKEKLRKYVHHELQECIKNYYTIYQTIRRINNLSLERVEEQVVLDKPSDSCLAERKVSMNPDTPVSSTSNTRDDLIKEIERSNKDYHIFKMDYNFFKLKNSEAKLEGFDLAVKLIRQWLDDEQIELSFLEEKRFKERFGDVNDK